MQTNKQKKEILFWCIMIKNENTALQLTVGNICVWVCPISKSSPAPPFDWFKFPSGSLGAPCGDHFRWYDDDHHLDERNLSDPAVHYRKPVLFTDGGLEFSFELPYPSHTQFLNKETKKGKKNKSVSYFLLYAPPSHSIFGRFGRFYDLFGAIKC